MYVSCALDDLYGGGNYPNGGDLSLIAAEIDRDAAASGIHVLLQIFGKDNYRWRDVAAGFPQATAFTQELAEFFENSADHNMSPSVLVRIEGAVLFGSIIYAEGSAGRRIVYETFRMCDRAAVPSPPEVAFESFDRTTFSDVDASYLMFGSAGSFNYGHWLVDDLPKIFAALALRDMQPGKRTVLLLTSFGAVIDQVRIDSLKLVLPSDIEIQFYPIGQLFGVVDLHFMTPVTWHPMGKHPAALKAFVDRAHDKSRSLVVSPTAKKLFITRTPGRTRSLLNHDALLPELLARGFTAINVEDYNFAEQLCLFRDAEQVVGVMGAAMTNTMFCSPGTDVLHLAPEGWREPFYIDLANVFGHRYRALYGSIEENGQPPHLSSFIISISDVLAALDN